MPHLRSPSLVLATFLALLGASFFLPSIPREAGAVPPGATIYALAGDEVGGNYAMLSNGNGTFGPVSLTFLQGDNNRGGAVEDFDNDGDLDFIRCNDDDTLCYLYKQDPAGTFANQGSVNQMPLNGIEMGMAAEDFDQDGKADYVVSGFNNAARTFAGNDAGAFTFASEFLAPVGTFRGKDASDINRDGYPDIAAAVTSGEVYIYYNNGSGGFGAATLALDTLGNSNDPHAVAVADFTGDRNLDIAGGGSLDGDVSLWTGDGNGAFTFHSQIFDFNGRTSIGNYDFDNDGDQDLLATTQSDSKVRYLAGNGNGTFQAPVEVGTLANSGIGMATPPSPPIRSKVTGKVFNDVNGNSTDDSEAGIGGVTLELSGTDYLGATVLQSVTSQSNGSYTFSDVRISNGNYTVKVSVPPAGFNATTTEFRTFTVPKEHTTITEHFGYKEIPKTGTVQGVVFDDQSQNGVRDGTEPALSGVSVRLSGTDKNGAAVAETRTTDGSGAYTFANINASSSSGYLLEVTTLPVNSEATTATEVTLLLSPDEVITRNFGFTFQLLPGGDKDRDGVTNTVDVCPVGTVLPESVPTEQLLPNHYAQRDSDSAFEVGLPGGGSTDISFTLADTKGCSCEQIIQARPGKEKGHEKFGCPKGIMEQWISTH